MNPTILLVEDEIRFRDILKDYFENDGFKVFEADNGVTALNIFQQEDIDLIVLDIMMPMLDGYSVCRKVRATSSVPIIFTTARGEEDDQLFGFELGADDYVIKPFSPKVLLARVKQLLLRTASLSDPQEPIKKSRILTRGAIQVNEDAHWVKIDDTLLDLAPKEYDILLHLIKNEGIAISREDLLCHIWGYEFFGDTRVIDTHIKKIRKKLGDEAKHIHTIIRVGYKFEVIK